MELFLTIPKKMKLPLTLLSLAAAVVPAMANQPAVQDEDVAVMVIIGQSNADGSAFSDPAIDKQMWEWYTTTPQAENLNIWYRSTQVINEPNALGQVARHVMEGKVRDAAPGWMKLWYRNNNVAGRTAMNMIHGTGTYSDVAQMRRGIEGRLGQRFVEAYPGRELYVIKLGVSGSGIDTWANRKDDTNWKFFADSVYAPAIQSLLSQGKRPRMAGVWWMQGCADDSMSEVDYRARLDTLVNRLDSRLGFGKVPVYIGAIPAPGASATPEGSVGFSPAVEAAKLAVAASRPNVTVIPTESAPMQYEEMFKGKIHFNHEGVNRIADILMDSIQKRGPQSWAPFLHSSADWELAWEEQFDGDTFNPKVWTKIPRGTANWNDVMSDADTLYAVRNGNLVLRGIKAYPALRDTVPYVTGGLYTKGKVAFGCGRVEILAKLQGARGAWPAIWMLPAPVDGKDVAWPKGGEIDIMERLNFDDFVYQTVHSYYTYVLGEKDHPKQGSTGKIDPDGYNVYAVELYPDSLSFYVNDVHTFTYPRIATDKEGQFPFDAPYYLLIDMQLGGSWVGAVDVNDLPVEMLVDRVSYYRRRN